jgi:hypothetical protein
MNSLIVGNGEIGKSLYNVLKTKYQIYTVDINEVTDVKIDIMHICFPYSKKFVAEVKKYKKLYKPQYTIIHSTVPVGTAKRCKCFYSPVRGIHPYLEKSLTTFLKYLAPSNEFLNAYFKAVGIKIKEIECSDSLEAMKLYCTTIYGLNIIAEKEIWEFCKKHNLDYNTVYTDCNITYNQGYKELGFPQFAKFVLKHYEGSIGGHCILPNCSLLKTDIAKFILKQNKKFTQ